MLLGFLVFGVTIFGQPVPAPTGSLDTSRRVQPQVLALNTRNNQELPGYGRLALKTPRGQTDGVIIDTFADTPRTSNMFRANLPLGFGPLHVSLLGRVVIRRHVLV